MHVQNGYFTYELHCIVVNLPHFIADDDREITENRSVRATDRKTPKQVKNKISFAFHANNCGEWRWKKTKKNSNNDNTNCWNYLRVRWAHTCFNVCLAMNNEQYDLFFSLLFLLFNFSRRRKKNIAELNLICNAYCNDFVWNGYYLSFRLELVIAPLRRLFVYDDSCVCNDKNQKMSGHLFRSGTSTRNGWGVIFVS